MSNRSSISRNKKSLKDIADQLNAVNKNQTIKGAFQGDANKINARQFNKIFKDEI
jgi:hypothetical protein